MSYSKKNLYKAKNLLVAQLKPWQSIQINITSPIRMILILLFVMIHLLLLIGNDDIVKTETLFFFFFFKYWSPLSHSIYILFFLLCILHLMFLVFKKKKGQGPGKSTIFSTTVNKMMVFISVISPLLEWAWRFLHVRYLFLLALSSLITFRTGFIWLMRCHLFNNWCKCHAFVFRASIIIYCFYFLGLLLLSCAFPQQALVSWYLLSY